MALLVTTSVVLVARGLSGSISIAGRLEIIGGLASPGVGCWFALTGRTRLGALAVVAVLLTVCLVHPAPYFFVLTHLHNLVPVAFVWAWSTRLRGTDRSVFRGIQLVWALVVPAVILLSWVGRPEVPAWLAPDAAQTLLRSTVPPGVDVDAPTAVRLVRRVRLPPVDALRRVDRFMPWAARDVTATFSTRFPVLAGWRFWSIVGGLTVIVLAIYRVDYLSGRVMYSLLASYPVSLEYPLLLVLAVASLRERRDTRAAVVTA